MSVTRTHKPGRQGTKKHTAQFGEKLVCVRYRYDHGVSSADAERTTRPVLTRARIVAAAVEIVDEAGPEALTMRATAERLGAGTMSLYRHVSGREELLDLVLAATTADLVAPALTGDWQRDLAAIARVVRAGLLRRPHLTLLLTTRSGRGGSPPTLLDLTLGVLRSAGFERQQAVLANHALGNYVAGAALWEAVGMAGMTGDERAAQLRAAAEAMAALPADTDPHVAWVGPAIVAGSLDERFEFGLQALIAGFAQSLPNPGG